MEPFGPVDNGNQHLYGLDYKSAMWRGDEENPFHTEVGYWLWDAHRRDPEGLRRPPGHHRAGRRTAAADATEFTLKAAMGDAQYSIGENQYLAQNASTLSYQVTITSATTLVYDEVTILKMNDSTSRSPTRTQHLRRVG